MNPAFHWLPCGITQMNILVAKMCVREEQQHCTQCHCRHCDGTAAEGQRAQHLAGAPLTVPAGDISAPSTDGAAGDQEQRRPHAPLQAWLETLKTLQHGDA